MKNAQGTSAFHFLPLTLRLLLSLAPIHRTTLFHSDCGVSLGLSYFIFFWHTALMSCEPKKLRCNSCECNAVLLILKKI